MLCSVCLVVAAAAEYSAAALQPSGMGTQLGRGLLEYISIILHYTALFGYGEKM